MLDFWNQNHSEFPVVEDLCKRYIPEMGATDYTEAEVLRAVMRVHYDFYNNGFGNNMSRDLAYIALHHNGPTEFRMALDAVKDAAMNLTGDGVEDSLVILVLASAHELKDAERENRLRPITNCIEDMPISEINYPEIDEGEWWDADNPD